MSNITIIFICASVILVAWLLRKYQDGAFNKNNNGKPLSQHKKKNTKNKHTKTLAQQVASAFPQNVVKDKVDDPFTAFICTEDGVQELAIIKQLANTPKKIQHMGGVTRITYSSQPSISELQKDLAGKLSVIHKKH